MYRLVETAENFPARCAVTTSIDGPFVDFGVWAGENYLYLRKQVVEDVARETLGMVPLEDVKVLEDRIHELAQKIQVLQYRLVSMENLKKLEKEVAGEEVAA